MEKIGYLGVGAWGYCLACLLASKGKQVVAWGIDAQLITHLKEKREHPKIPGFPAPSSLTFTNDLAHALDQADLLIEAVTSTGIRQVFQNVKDIQVPTCPIVLTSKGIEQNTGFLLSDVLIEVFGESIRQQIGCLSGPSMAEEVLQNLPTSVVCSAFAPTVTTKIHEAFSTPTFRIYPNADINGVQLGGAVKNIIAIACGASDGLGFGDNAKAALATRGLYEMSKLAPLKNCQAETFTGLAGLGDLCLTCFSSLSRNYRFGRLVAEGMDVEDAKKKIGMVVEGTNTCLSVYQLAKKANLDLPITEAVYKVTYEHMNPHDAVNLLLQRPTKGEMG